MTTSTSTIIETININYNDFNESFLTCATCLYPFDTDSHRPKLLSCSHTVCKTCLERIAELPQSQDTENSGTFLVNDYCHSRTNEAYAVIIGIISVDRMYDHFCFPDFYILLVLESFEIIDSSFRCPICRETIPVPRSGVQSLPPSFVINQLIDLMSRQRRDLVPKCATHANEELLFCETCDIVFCSLCSSSTTSSSTTSPLTLSSSLILPPADPMPSTSNLCSTSTSQLNQNSNDLGTVSSPSRHTTSSANINSNPRYHQASQCLNHTVVPFSIAIKRMSEILLYKATQCTKNLNKAAENVRKEMDMLDLNADKVVDQVNSSFQNNCCIIVKCPKNPTHFIPVMELSHHLSDRCLDSGLDDFCTELRTAVKIKEKSALAAAAETVTTTKIKTATRFGGINTTALNAII
uniref:RING-type domain-containing protein n=1 Tax=Romanomermis culicivorax TaxID=13658 RepID=A0A915KBF1_ROMCU